MTPTASTGRHRQASAVLATRLSANWEDSGRPASLQEHLARFPYGPPPRIADGGRLIEAVTQAGLTGRGGAGFPTGVKMRAVADRRGPAVVVLNGLESEPASAKDKMLLGRAPHLALDGAVLAAVAVGADEVDVCLPRNAGWLLATMHNAVTERARAGIDPVMVRLHDLPHGYVSSSETAVVNWLNGGPAKPVATPPRPFEKGVARRPTLLANAETLAHVALIGRFGSAWFRRLGTQDAPGSMLTTITGGVAAPGVYEIEVGTPVGAALGLAEPHEHVRHVLIGGYFGTWHDLDSVGTVPLAGPALRKLGASPGAGVLVALPPGACGLIETARVLWWLAGQGAEQCGPCLFGLPAIADDFAQLAAGRPHGSPLDRLDRRLGTVSGRGACAHPDGAVRLARSALSAFAADAKAHASARRCLYAYRGSSPRAHVLPIPVPQGTDRWR
jgi:NADH:ubiquinone oxidoreductase subunit F (NADH-binding)